MPKRPIHVREHRRRVHTSSGIKKTNVVDYEKYILALRQRKDIIDLQEKIKQEKLKTEQQSQNLKDAIREEQQAIKDADTADEIRKRTEREARLQTMYAQRAKHDAELSRITDTVKGIGKGYIGIAKGIGETVEKYQKEKGGLGDPQKYGSDAWWVNQISAGRVLWEELPAGIKVKLPQLQEVLENIEAKKQQLTGVQSRAQQVIQKDKKKDAEIKKEAVREYHREAKRRQRHGKSMDKVRVEAVMVN